MYLSSRAFHGVFLISVHSMGVPLMGVPLLRMPLMGSLSLACLSWDTFLKSLS